MKDDLRGGGLVGASPHPESSFLGLLSALELTPSFPQTSSTAAGLTVNGLGAQEGTTVLALRYAQGVAMVGDRQATEGYLVAHRRIQKVFSGDDFSAVAVSGTAGLALEMVRLFQTELEHYEKLEGVRLSLDGKANFLARIVRQQLPLAFEGLAVVPLFAGFDQIAGSGRLYTFDIVGGRYEEIDYGATGSGGRDAKAYLRASFVPDAPEPEALAIGLRALVAAAEEDTATAGPDLRRGIYPTVVTVTAEGFREVPETDVAAIAAAAVEAVR
ncbi:MAG TPA: proteasome subunit beta [Acidimicrobiia bacterium]